MPSVNVKIPKPVSPGWWVDEVSCVCGEFYSEFNCGLKWEQGVDLVRSVNAGRAYFSRGPVLWALRCLKLQEWYIRHAQCWEFEGDTYALARS